MCLHPQNSQVVESSAQYWLLLRWRETLRERLSKHVGAGRAGPRRGGHMLMAVMDSASGGGLNRRKEGDPPCGPVGVPRQPSTTCTPVAFAGEENGPAALFTLLWLPVWFRQLGLVPLCCPRSGSRLHRDSTRKRWPSAPGLRTEQPGAPRPLTSPAPFSLCHPRPDLSPRATGRAPREGRVTLLSCRRRYDTPSPAVKSGRACASELQNLPPLSPAWLHRPHLLTCLDQGAGQHAPGS